MILNVKNYALIYKWFNQP